MIEKLLYAGIVFTGFLAIMNPISSISIFLTLTGQKSEEDVKNIAFQSTLTALLIVIIFALVGHFLLTFFGVTFTALRLTGGIIVGIIGYGMLQGGKSIVENPMKEEGSVAITPLGIPLLAGPGVIITAMNFSAGGIDNCLITIISFGLLCIITYFFFIFGKQIKKIVGTNILKVITKMMGLILAVIGMQMFIEGVYSAIKDFQALNYF
ncbi:MAG: MarC family protein [Candidatus Gastranaerophilales bacterium]|nr:MarC family protein [Candidatus Gastranaerophilales bacterium]